MTEDPIVEQVRKVRHEIETECNNDPTAYVQYLRQVQQRYVSRVTRGHPTLTVRPKAG